MKAPVVVVSLIPPQAWSFPSGHAMVSAAFYLFLAYLGWRLLTGWRRVLWFLALAGLVPLIGLSRRFGRSPTDQEGLSGGWHGGTPARRSRPP